MKVYQLNTYCGVKSTGRIVSQLAKALSQSGNECRIGYGVPGISTETKKISYRVGNIFSRKIHGAIRKFADAEGYGSYIATEFLLADMNRFKPDIVHLHNIHGCYLNHKVLFHYLSQKKIPVVWTLHDCWPFTGHCAYFDAVDCQKWKTKCYGCEQLQSYPCCVGLDGSSRNYLRKKNLFTSLVRLTLVSPCDWMELKAKSSYLQKANLCVIPNGVDTDLFFPVSSSIRDDYHLENKKLILSVASDWDERKGLRYLLDASAQLDDHYQFAVVGLNEEQRKNLPSNIIAVPPIHDSFELARWYSCADCFANPTLEDNMPMVNLEALACGTPIVAFDTGGCAQAIGKCGSIVMQKDLAAFCDKIRIFAEKKVFISEDCLKQAASFNVEKMTSAYLKLYKEIIQ